MAAASEERMAEEGGGSHGDGGSCSASGSAQRQPPPTPSQAPQPGSQAPAAPALAPDHLPQNNTLVALPIVAIENILSFMSYDEISQLRLVSLPAPRGTPATLGRRGTRSAPLPAAGQCPRGRPAGCFYCFCTGILSPWRARLRAFGGLLAPSPGRVRRREVTELRLGARRPAEQGSPRGLATCLDFPPRPQRPAFREHTPQVGRGSQLLGLCCKTSVLFLQPPKLPG